MNNDFLASLNKLIGDEAARLATQKAENDRLAEQGRQEKERVDALQPQILTKLGEVSTIWGECLAAVQAKSQDLGFTADISGGREGEWYTLQVNFHMHSGLSSNSHSLQLIVTERAVGQFKPVHTVTATSFDFLPADSSVFTDRLLDHVTNLFHKIRDEQ